MSPQVSIVVPLHDEAASVDEFVRRTVQTMEAYPDEWELLLIDDASSDGTWDRLEALRARLGDRVRPDRLPQRSGQVGAQRRGIELARGGRIVFIDGDLQIPPEQIPQVADRLRTFDVVATYHSHLRTRKRLLDPRVLLYAPANRFGNFLLRVLLHTNVRSASSDFLGIRAQFLKGAPLGWNDQRYLIPIALRRGARTVTELSVEKQKRMHGRSKYSIAKKMITGIFDIVAVYRRVQSGYYDPQR